MKLTVVNNNDGLMHVHATGCPDLARGKYHFANGRSVAEAATAEDVLVDIWSDFIAERGDQALEEGEDSTVFFPCTGFDTTLPATVEPETTQERERWLRGGAWKVLPEQNRHLRGHGFYPPFAELATIPNLYDQDGQHYDETAVHLHYFCAAGDWWITELDPGDGRAFGYTRLATFPDGAEWGYLHLTELEELVVPGSAIISSGGQGRIEPPVVVERDLHWTPRPAAEAIPGLTGGRA